MNEVDVNQLDARMAMLSSTWSDKVMPLLNQYPHILRNLFQYCFYHNQFAIKNLRIWERIFMAIPLISLLSNQ